MFDTLTLHDLAALHTSLFETVTRVHYRMLAPDGAALVSVFSQEWAVLRAAHDELKETMAAVFAEIQARQQEAIDA